MPGNSATVSIAIEVDDKGSVKIRQLGEAARKAGDEGARGFEQMGRSAGAMDRGVNTATASMRSLLGIAAGVAGAISAIGVGNQFLQTAKEFERFNAQLTTLKGSSEEARQALDWMTDFAAKTPYALNQVVEAFVKLESYGLSGTRWMQTLGDTAAAMGKPLSQAVEAVADAVTGEFERLKEFGVRAKQEGDTVAFSWTQNGEQMTASSAKTSEDIQKTLEQIFSRFGGQMVLMSSTWEGMMSNLGDWWSNFQRQVMDSGLFDSLKKQLAGVLVTLDQLKKDGTMDKMAKDVADLGQLILDALPSAFTAVITGIDLVGKAFLGWQVIWNGLAHVFTALVGGIIAGFNAMITQMRLGFADFITTISSSWAKVQSAVLSVDGGAIAGGSGLDIAALRAEELDSKLAKLQQAAASAKAEIMASGAAGQKTADEWLASADKYGAAFTKSVDATIAWDNSMKGIKSAVEAYSASVDASKAKVAGMADGMGKAGDAADTAGRQTEELATQTDKATKAAKDKEKAAKDMAKTFADTHRDMIADVNAWAAKQEEGKAVLAETEEAYKDLGLTSQASYEAQVKAAVDAYRTIANAAGTSDADRERARVALQGKLNALEEEYTGKVKGETEKVNQLWTNLLGDIESALGTFVYDFLTGEFDSIGDLFDDLCSSILRAFANLIAEMVAKWAMSGLMGLFTGQGFSGFNMAAMGLGPGGVTSGWGDSISSLIGGGSSVALSQYGPYASGYATGGGAAGVSGMSAAGAGLGVAGGAYGLYNAAGQAASGNANAGTALQAGISAYSIYKGFPTVAAYLSSLGSTSAAAGTAAAAYTGAGSLAYGQTGSVVMNAMAAEQMGTAAGSAIVAETTAAGTTAAAGSAGAGGASGAGMGAGMGMAGAAAGALALWGGIAYGINKLGSTPTQQAVEWDQLNNYGTWGRDQGSFRSDQRPGWEISGSGDAEMQSWGTIESTASKYGFEVLEGEILSFVEAAKQSLADLTSTMGQEWADLAAGLENSVPAYDAYLDAIMGVDVAMEQSAEIHRLAQQAAADNGASLVHLTNALKAMGMSDEMARASAVALVAAVDQQQAASVSAASAAQSMAAAVADFSNTPLNIRVNVGVREQPYRIENHNPYAVHASGGIFASPTLIPSINGRRHLVGEAGAEAITPLHAGPDTLKKMDAKLDALISGGRPVQHVINLDGRTIATATLPYVDAHVAGKASRGALSKRTVF